MTVDILWQDDNALLCRKPAGVLSQSGNGENMLSLLEAQTGLALYPVHRLDKETTGLILYAKTKEGAAFYSQAVQSKQMRKIYRTVIIGAPAEPTGDFTDLLYHDKAKNKVYPVKRLRKGVKEARISYEVLATAQQGAQTLSLVQVQLDTGRTHQIRVQFASRKMPVAGDGKYGGRAVACPLALHAYSLTFAQMGTGEQLTFTDSPMTGAPWNLF